MEDRLSRATQGADGGGSEPRQNSAPKSSEAGTDVLGILEDIESQFDRLRTIRGDQVAALRELAERSARLEEKKIEIDALQSRLEETQQEWERSRQHQHQALVESQQCLEADRGSHLRRMEEDKATLARDRASLDEDRARLNRESDSQRLGFDEIRSELDTLRTDLDIRSQELQETAQHLSDQETCLNQKAVEQQDRENAWLDALQIARHIVSKRGQCIRKQQTKIEKLTAIRDSLVRRRRGLESAARRYRSSLEELEGKVDSQESRLEEAGRRLRAFMEQLREQADLVERGNAALALVDQLEGRIDELENALSQSGDSSQTDARIRSLETELEEARSQVKTLEPAMKELKRLQNEQTSQDQAKETDAANRTERLAEIAQRLHARRTRLRRLRQALRNHRQAGIESSSSDMISKRLRQSEIIEQRQQELDDVRRILANSEKKMIKKWAAPRSLVLTSWALLLIVIIAGASWISAEHIRPALRTASVVLEPNLPAGSQLSDEASMAWMDFHQSQLTREGFIRDVARRSAGRKLAPWDSHESVSRILNKNITLDKGDPNKLVLTIAANDPDRAAAFLDILATSMVLDAQRTITSRPGGNTSKVLDDRTDGGVLRYARVDPTPIRDERIMTAGILFMGGMVLSFMMMGVVYARLLRAKRIFEQDHSEDIPVNTIQARPI